MCSCQMSCSSVFCEAALESAQTDKDGSLVQMPPWANPYLIVSASISTSCHFVILYVPGLATIFGLVPLTLRDWLLLLAFSFPVILLDEILKFIGRSTLQAAIREKDKDAYRAQASWFNPGVGQ